MSLSTESTRCKYYTCLGGVVATIVSFKGGLMRSKDVQLGMLVRVSELHRNLDYRGQTGVVGQRYGHVDYAAFDIQFVGGRSELFWHHEFVRYKGFTSSPLTSPQIPSDQRFALFPSVPRRCLFGTPAVSTSGHKKSEGVAAPSWPSSSTLLHHPSSQT